MSLFAKLRSPEPKPNPANINSVQTDARIHLRSQDLLALKAQAHGFIIHPRQAIQNQYTGRHRSRQRGRGLNFEELGHYRIGDDIRTMDWKVSNRTGKPHVRVYTEERERPIMLACDQRSAMFFGSQHKMKSVVAAELLGLLAWRQLALGDAIASLMYSDTQTLEFSPQRSRDALIHSLQQLSRMNQSLSCESALQSLQSREDSLCHALKCLLRLCPRNYVLVLISDLHGFGEPAAGLLKSLALQNDVFVLHVLDPAEQQLPSGGELVVSDSHQQLAVDCNDSSLAKAYAQHSAAHQEALAAQLRRWAVSYIPIDTLQPAQDQLRRALPEARLGR